ncbi:hypothetical protein QE152_g36508 [Popillia japonica]|uniref:Uncharacterized protein n=1 Tax=Popillia japonica TaxID=7064 RepID=A0AAW1IDC2_POPJA
MELEEESTASSGAERTSRHPRSDLTRATDERPTPTTSTGVGLEYQRERVLPNGTSHCDTSEFGRQGVPPVSFLGHMAANTEDSMDTEEGTTRLDVAQKRRLEDIDLPPTSGSEGEPDRSTANVWFGGRTRRRRMDRGKSA